MLDRIKKLIDVIIILYLCEFVNMVDFVSKWIIKIEGLIPSI